MKNLILLFALLTSTFSLMAQNATKVNHITKNSIKAKNGDKKLSKFELQGTRGTFFVPRINANVYLKENTILRFASPSLSYGTISDLVTGNKYELNTFLEFRKYKSNKVFLSHGPAVGFRNVRTIDSDGFTQRENEYSVGYNLGGGYRLNKHLTAGTYFNPHVTFGDNEVQVRQGRLFAGILSNIYVAYRF